MLLHRLANFLKATMKIASKKLLFTLLFFISHLGVAADMSNKGEHFLASPPEQLAGLQNPKVISFGCGRTAHIEINRLQQIFGQNFIYVCIEKDPEKLEQYTVQKGSTIFLYAADGSDLSGLLSLGLKLNDFDVAIVRHPDFHSYGDAFKKIFRKVIPHLLKRDGMVAVSLLHEDEAMFVAKKNAEDPHEKIDTLLFDLQYRLITHIRLPHVDPDMSHPGSGRDKLQYYFQNSCNRAHEKLSVFTIYVSLHENPFLPKVIEHLEGKVVEQSENTITVRLNPSHMQSLNRIYELYAEEIKREYCQNPSCQVYESENKKLMQCGRCKKVSYCSKECQKTHRLANHKHLCNQ